MPWVNEEWWEPSATGTPEVDGDRAGVPQPTGVYGPNGQELYRIQPVGFNRKPELVYVRRRQREHS